MGTPIFILVVLGLVGFAVVTGITSYFAFYNESINTMQQQNRALINRMEGWLGRKSTQTENNAMIMREIQISEDGMREYFGLLADIMYDVSVAFAGFPDGRIVFGGEWEVEEDVFAPARPWYIAAAESPGQVIFSNPYMGTATRNLAFAAARTVSNYDDSLGVVALSLPFDRLADYVAQDGALYYGFSSIVDNYGNVLFHVNPYFEPEGDFTFQSIYEIDGGRYAQMFESIRAEGVYIGGGIVYIGSVIDSTGWFVITQVPSAYVFERTLPTLLSLVATIVFISVSMFWISQMLRKIKISASIEQEDNEINKVFIDSSPFVMNIWDSNKNLMLTSEHASEMFELANKEQYVRSFWQLSPESQPCGTKSAELAGRYLDEALDNNTTIKFDWLHQTLAGTPIPTEVMLVPFTHRGKMMVAAYTVDKRKEIENIRRVTEANEMNRLFLEMSPFAIDVWDEDLQVVDCNRQILELFKLSSKQEYFDNFFKLSPEYQPCGTPSEVKALKCMQEALEKGSVRFEFTHRTLDGEFIPTDITLIRVMRNSRKMILGYIVDLRALREAEERIKLMLDATPLAISLYDRNSTTVDCNLEALKMFMLPTKLNFSDVATETMPAYQPDGTCSKNLLDRYVTEAFESGSAYAEFVSMRSDGSLFPSEATWVRVKHKDDFLVVEYLRDLTVEKLAQQREQDANELTRIIMDNTPICIEIWDEDSELIYCNQKMLDVSGVATFEDYKDRFVEFSGEFQPDGESSAKKLEDMLNIAMSVGFSRFEWTHLTASGEPVPYESQFVRIVKQGEFNIVGYSHDVREIKNALSKIYAADERATLMMGATPISCFMTKGYLSEEGTWQFVPIDFNKAAMDLFGFSSREEVVERFYDIFPTTDDIPVPDMIHMLADTAMEAGYDQFKFVHRRLDGELVPCEITIVRVEYKGDQVLACFQTDLRPMMAAIEQERNAREQTQRFLDSAPIFIEIWNKDLQLIECNKSAIEMFGLSSESEYIEKFDSLSPEYQPDGTLSAVKSRALVAECFKKGMSTSEWMHHDANGELLPVDLTYVRIRRGEEDIVVGYNQDLRAIKLAMAKEREAEKENRAKTQFLARMSHEVRTPMNSVLGITEIELQKSGHPRETEEAFQRIYNSSRLLLTIINDILDLSKVEAGKMEILPARYEMASLIADTVQLNMMYIGSKRIEFKLEADENLPAYFIGDELRIKQVLNNILSNAFKYTTEGEVRISFAPGEVSGDDDSTMLVIKVSDTGQGMNEEQIAKLFGTDAEYTRFNVAENRGIEGSGLGMSIANSLVKMMGGHIAVTSEAGRGSTFA
ncbi:MAG: PAS domain-containing protein, partial [Defluviitaleaceae bacterium]|nr:PAS domain-containing protein [Defluviitaleaceae bacterium]